MSGYTAITDSHLKSRTVNAVSWTKIYLRRAAIIDSGCAIIAVCVALAVRFGSHITLSYALFSILFPVLWAIAMTLSGGYDDRFFGTGSDEFRKVLNAGVSLTAGLAIFSYAINNEVSRIFLVIAMPGVTVLNLAARFGLRQWLHCMRTAGRYMLTVVAVGHES